MEHPLSKSPKRPHCKRCHVPLTRCLCAICPSNLKLPFPIVVFQHPDEENHYLNTVRLLKLSCDQITVIITHSPKLSDLDPSYQWYLLFPGDGARKISQIKNELINKKMGLVILDGTWKKTKKFLFENIFLQHLPRLSLENSYETIYELRKCDRHNFLSTLEAFSYLLIEDQQIELGNELIQRMKIMIAEQKKRFQEPTE